MGNTINGAVTAIDAKTGEVKGRSVLDDRKRSDTVKPLQPRQLVADDATHTVYITGVGKERDLGGGWHNAEAEGYHRQYRYLRHRPALDAQAKRLYTTNADGELVTIDTASNKIISRKRCRMMAKSTST